MITPRFDKNFGPWFLNDVHRAMNKYDMISKGETVFAGLSGGKDSMVLVWILSYLSRFSHLDFQLHAAHVRIAEYDTTVLHQFCADLQVPYHEVNLQTNGVTEKVSCSLCSRIRRGALSQLLLRHNASCLAYGHHADDAAQTLLMNMLFNRKLGSFSPVVCYTDNPLRVIRPMIYLPEKTIARLHSYLSIPTLAWHCSKESHTMRDTASRALTTLENDLAISDISRRMVASLENLDTTNIWSNNEHDKND